MITFPLNHSKKTGFHQAVQDRLYSLTDDSLPGLNKDTTEDVSEDFHIDGIPVRLKSSPNTDMTLWGDHSSLLFTVAGQVHIQFRVGVTEQWTLWVSPGNTRTVAYQGPLSEWVPLGSIRQVVDKIVDVMRDIPLPHVLESEGYPRSFQFVLDADHTFNRADYESDEALEQAVKEADVGLQESWESRDIPLSVSIPPSKAARFMDLGISQCVDEKDGQRVQLTLPMNRLATMHQLVQDKIQHYADLCQEPPESELVDIKTLQRNAKKMAQDLEDLHAQFYGAAQLRSRYYYWAVPTLTVWR